MIECANSNSIFRASYYAAAVDGASSVSNHALKLYRHTSGALTLAGCALGTQTLTNS